MVNRLKATILKINEKIEELTYKYRVAYVFIFIICVSNLFSSVPPKIESKLPENSIYSRERIFNEKDNIIGVGKVCLFNCTKKIKNNFSKITGNVLELSVSYHNFFYKNSGNNAKNTTKKQINKTKNYWIKIGHTLLLIIMHIGFLTIAFCFSLGFAYLCKLIF